MLLDLGFGSMRPQSQPSATLRLLLLFFRKETLISPGECLLANSVPGPADPVRMGRRETG